MKRAKIKQPNILTDRDLLLIKKQLKADISVRQLSKWWNIPLTTFRRILINNNIL